MPLNSSDNRAVGKPSEESVAVSYAGKNKRGKGEEGKRGGMHPTAGCEEQVVCTCWCALVEKPFFAHASWQEIYG